MELKIIEKIADKNGVSAVVLTLSYAEIQAATGYLNTPWDPKTT